MTSVGICALNMSLHLRVSSPTLSLPCKSCHRACLHQVPSMDNALQVNFAYAAGPLAWSVVAFQVRTAITLQGDPSICMCL